MSWCIPCDMGRHEFCASYDPTYDCDCAVHNHEFASMVEEYEIRRPNEMAHARELVKLEHKINMLEMQLAQFTHCRKPCSNPRCRCCFAHPGPCDVDQTGSLAKEAAERRKRPVRRSPRQENK